MMYNNKLAIALKSNGKVLRESGETVFLPFGSEYSVYIKNLNTVRALVHVEIDGQDVGEGGFVVDPNTSLDIERFIKNGNLAEGNRFKFIEMTSDIEEHRGVGVEDGLIRVEFQFERPRVTCDWEYFDQFKPIRKTWHEDDLLGGPTYGVTSSTQGAANISRSTNRSKSFAADASAPPPVDYSLESNDAGITVPGSVSDQQFRTVASFPLEVEKHVMVLKLLGETENQRVMEPVTVKTKPKCTTCGRVNKATAKFCTNCGTSLTLV